MCVVEISPTVSAVDTVTDGDLMYVLDYMDRPGEPPTRRPETLHCRVVQATPGLDATGLERDVELMPEPEDAGECYRMNGWEHRILDLYGHDAGWARLELAAPTTEGIPDGRMLSAWLFGDEYRIRAYRRHEEKDDRGSTLVTWEQVGEKTDVYLYDGHDWMDDARAITASPRVEQAA